MRITILFGGTNKERLVSVATAQVYLFIFLASVALGTLIGGPIGDRIGRKAVIWGSILGAIPFALLLPLANLFWTPVLTVIIGATMASASSAIIVYAIDLVPGKIGTMAGLFFGLAAAIVLIYLLIVVNFQSWLDPFLIITALPAALAGIVWMLFATGTTLSVPALTGAIMCMGVATANSILVVSFARERLAATGNAALAAVEAGMTRFRPVLMTALAMVIGMAPMALGLGEGGEQNAPLGRAVIGGLIFATVATLMFVPVVFSMVHKKQGAKAAAALETAHAH